jgi:hypothetical protein
MFGKKKGAPIGNKNAAGGRGGRSSYAKFNKSIKALPRNAALTGAIFHGTTGAIKGGLIGGPAGAGIGGLVGAVGGAAVWGGAGKFAQSRMRKAAPSKATYDRRVASYYKKK